MGSSEGYGLPLRVFGTLVLCPVVKDIKMTFATAVVIVRLAAYHLEPLVNPWKHWQWVLVLLITTFSLWQPQ